MKTDFFHQNITKLLSQRKGLVALTALLAFSNVLLCLIVFGKREQVILVPPQITKSLRVQGDVISKEYLEEIGVYMAKLLLDLSPSSYSYNHEVLLKYVAPESYGALKKKLLKDGDQYTTLQLSTSFKPSQVTAYPKTLQVDVIGTLTSYIAGKEADSSQELVTLEFTQRGGGLLLKRVRGGLQHES